MSDTRLPRPIPPGWLALIGGPFTGLTVALTSRDWCCATVGMTVLAGITISALEKFVLARVWRKPWIRRAQVGLVLAIAIISGTLLRADRNALFKQAFGVDPPEGVQKLVADQALIGISGELDILLRFRADEKTMTEILGHRGFKKDEAFSLRQGEGEPWEELWKHSLASHAYPWGSAWRNPEPMKRPILYKWSGATPNTGSEYRHSEWRLTQCLWDAESERAYVVSTD